ncbi:Uu.00g109390.m01.CDS01 [Anthostomella pinea]|uniref:thioredoxin-dependent peroxiredoxin n=1 Tax=Anthostomella pinea TaxID=933095 RepID=A0AAI8VF68_9PEZI|nr:Uu.00g109390.m01.CDS01 [Anthostomella pinea]
MSLAEQLSAVASKASSVIKPEFAAPIAAGHAKFLSTFNAASVVKPGDKLPAFTMLNATGQPVTSASLLAKGGPLLITFYRGEWCPFCNLAIASLQKHLPEFEARGVTLVAVSPELPNGNMTMTEKHELRFPVLTDLHNALARQLGIMYDQSGARDFHKSVGIDLEARNGDDSWEVPIPATLLVDREGVVRNAWVNPDFKTRLDPKVALAWIDALEMGAN